MASKQESNSAYYEMAKQIAKTEKELGFERWVRIEITVQGTTEERAYFYDLPRDVYERREWVIRWRAARIQCQNPRRQVRTFHDYYRRMSGNDLGMQKDIDTFIAAKAAVTKQRNNLERYIASQKQDMFFDEANDPTIQMAKRRLEEREESVRQAEIRMNKKVQEYMTQHQTA